MANRDRIEVWTALVRAHAALSEVLEDEMHRERGIPLSWFDVLATLEEAPAGRMRMQDLAHEVLLSKSGLTRLFDRMEDAGLVARRSCPEDARGTFAALTPEGRRMWRRALPVYRRVVARHFARNLTDREAREMQAALRKILRDLGRADPVRAAAR